MLSFKNLPKLIKERQLRLVLRGIGCLEIVGDNKVVVDLLVGGVDGSTDRLFRKPMDRGPASTQGRNQLIASRRRRRTIEIVNSHDLTRPQLLALAAQIGRQRDYLARLHGRMQALSFPASDPLYAAVARALEAASNLTVVAASKANSAREPTIMEKMPWAGEGARLAD